jgi:Mrp family chromosome partitioning ATPase
LARRGGVLTLFAVAGLLAGAAAGGWLAYAPEAAGLPMPIPPLPTAALQGLAIIATGGAFGAVAGCLLGVVYAALTAPKAVTTVQPDALERLFGAPLLGAAPLVTARALRSVAPDLRTPAGLVAGAPQAAFSESMRDLSAKLGRWRDGGGGAVAAITSALPAEGATSVALGAARAAALAGRRVIVIDADVRARTLSRTLEASPQAGLWEVLEGQTALEAAIVGDPFTAADLLPLRWDGNVLSEIFAHPRLTPLLETLQARYDLVLFDCPPALATVDGRMTAVRIGAVALVAQWNATPIPAIAAAHAALESLGARQVCLFLNAAAPAAAQRWRSMAVSPEGVQQAHRQGWRARRLWG